MGFAILQTVRNLLVTDICQQLYLTLCDTREAGVCGLADRGAGECLGEREGDNAWCQSHPRRQHCRQQGTKSVGEADEGIGWKGYLLTSITNQTRI